MKIKTGFIWKASAHKHFNIPQGYVIFKVQQFYLEKTREFFKKLA
jgi:hypothetical protein